ncbi:MAG: TetR/AcrR family transcriptional regulator [Myxococcota bacterium]
MNEMKREQILIAAQASLVRFGLKGSSVEAIAKAAGVSKVTIYKHFNNLDGLAAAVMSRAAEGLYADLRRAADAPGTPRQQVERVCLALVQEINRETLQALERILYEVALQDPDTGRRIFELGPQRTLTLLASLLQETHGSRARSVAEKLMALLRGGEQYRVWLSVRPPLSPEEQRRYVQDCLDWALGIE